MAIAMSSGGGHGQMAIGIVANVCDDNVVLVRRLRETAADVRAPPPRHHGDPVT